AAGCCSQGSHRGRVYFAVMPTRPKFFVSALIFVVLATLSTAMAQVSRVVVFPFDADATSQAYQLGLASALQRALNQIPGVYAPPVGDTALVANRAVAVGVDVNETVGRLFNASALVTGQVTLAGGGVRAVVNVKDRKSTRLNSSHVKISYA